MESIEDLERKKLSAELEKLRVETSLLQKSWYQRPNLLISLLGVLFGAVQFYSAEKKVESVSEQEKDNKIFSQYMEKTIIDNQQEIKSVGSSEAGESAEVVMSNIIDVWAFNVSEDLVAKVKSELKSQGNIVGFGGVLSSRPSWLSLDSTVLYYDRSSKKVAEQLAVKLNDLAKMNFKVKRGAGYGVKKGEEAKTFFIHIVQ